MADACDWFSIGSGSLQCMNFNSSNGCGEDSMVVAAALSSWANLWESESRIVEGEIPDLLCRPENGDISYMQEFCGVDIYSHLNFVRPSTLHLERFL